MPQYKMGQRLSSNTCDTQVMIIKLPAGDHVIACGGAEMTDPASAEKSATDPALSGGTLMGKRYTDEGETAELLCVKPGAGTLSLDGVALVPKQAKALPSSD